MCYCNLTEKLVHFAKHSDKNVTRLTCQLTHSEYNSLYSIQTNKKPVWFFFEKMKREKKTAEIIFWICVTHFSRVSKSIAEMKPKTREPLRIGCVCLSWNWRNAQLNVKVDRETEQVMNTKKWQQNTSRNDKKKTQSLCRFTQQIEQTCKSTDEIQFDLWHIYEIYETK